MNCTKLQKRNLQVDFYRNRILDRYAQKDFKSVTLKQLIMFGRQVSKSPEKLLQSANYIREELPVRLAHRIRKFQQLPFVVGTNPQIAKCYNLYWEAFEAFRSVKEIKTLEDNDEYCRLIEGMLSTHKVIIPLLVTGIHESHQYMNQKELNKFMNETLQSRVSRRVLAEQHLCLSKDFKNQNNSVDHIGVVSSQCKALDIVQKCVKRCDELFMNSFHKLPPQVNVDGHLNATFTYIPEHIEYILFEIVKNSMRFTQEAHESSLPPIKITVGEGDNQVMFRVSDQGKGIPKDLLDDIWNFVKPIRSDDISKQPELIGTMDERIPLNVSLGVGLPMCRVYAKYWGGSISLYSMNGYGTDVYVTLNTSNSFENLNFDE